MDSKKVHSISFEKDIKIKDETPKNTKIKAKKPGERKKRKKIIIAVVIVLLLAIAAGVACYFIFFNNPKTEEETPKAPEETKYYSVLTGEEIASDALNKSPVYCIQIPNGDDGARPQTGLTKAAIVFEAIAEAGITRFAAIYQNADTSALGPIRSLRSYYLDWDTPFDCTIVHAGGSDDAVAAVSSGRYRDLTESLAYMWRDNSAYWAPNNLMTSSALLEQHAKNNNYSVSRPKAFARFTPEEVKELTTSNPEESEEATESKDNLADDTITVKFGYSNTYNVRYTYDKETNSYLRAYTNGAKHISYECPSTLDTPKPKSDCGDPSQVAPKAVAVMMVDQWTDRSDNYHQIIQTIGTGKAYIFQNGTVTLGTWKKSDQKTQIIFEDEDGNEIKFVPGQLWISAVPNTSGSIDF